MVEMKFAGRRQTLCQYHKSAVNRVEVRLKLLRLRAVRPLPERVHKRFGFAPIKAQASPIRTGAKEGEKEGDFVQAEFRHSVVLGHKQGSNR